jgi:hypothetical protein
MSRKVLQVNLRFHASRAEYEALVAAGAEPMAAAPGLSWSVWLINETDGEGGSICLFADSRSLESFLNSEMLVGLVKHPLVSDLSVKQLDVVRTLSGVARGRGGALSPDEWREEAYGS